MTSPPPVWLRGPIPDIQPALQPVAHALLQVAEETPEVLQPLSREQIWARPGGSASIGFHVAHLAGSLDRLPSTTLGILFHAAEHSIRHGGQIITLARVVLPHN